MHARASVGHILLDIPAHKCNSSIHEKNKKTNHHRSCSRNEEIGVEMGPAGSRCRHFKLCIGSLLVYWNLGTFCTRWPPLLVGKRPHGLHSKSVWSPPAILISQRTNQNSTQGWWWTGEFPDDCSSGAKLKMFECSKSSNQRPSEQRRRTKSQSR